jgi:hypothetical protein
MALAPAVLSALSGGGSGRLVRPFFVYPVMFGTTDNKGYRSSGGVMKQAVREIRQGKVRVAECLIFDDSPAIALLRSRMEVCEVALALTLYTREIWFVGHAPEFDTIDL